MSFHKLDKAKDKNFCSVRVNSDIRLIVHRSEGSLLLCYADHHDKAYDWAERPKLETHPKTGAAQLVELREASACRPALFHSSASRSTSSRSFSASFCSSNQPAIGGRRSSASWAT